MKLTQIFINPIKRIKSLPRNLSLIIEFFLIIFVIILIIIASYFLNIVIGKSLYDSIVQNTNQHKWDTICILVNQNIEKSNILTDYLTDTIFEELHKNNNNTDLFKTKLQRILESVKDSRINRNKYITNVLILSDANIVYNANNITENRRLYELKDSFYNKKLLSDSIDSVLGNSKKILFWESGNTKINNHMYIETCDMSLMKNVFMKEGLDGLKNYVFIVPYRIYDKRYSDLKLFNTFYGNTLDLVITFNIYDYIITQNPAQFQNDEFMKCVDAKINIPIAIRIIPMILMLIIVCGFMLKVHMILYKYLNEIKLSFVKDIDDYKHL